MTVRTRNISVTSLLLAQATAALEDATGLLTKPDPGANEDIGRGLAWTDYDGWQDLYVVNLNGSGHLYHNLGDPEGDGHNGFELAANTNSEPTGLEPLGVVVGEYNNDGYDDGDLDLYPGSFSGAPQCGFFFENQGQGAGYAFLETSSAAGLGQSSGETTWARRSLHRH